MVLLHAKADGSGAIEEVYGVNSLREDDHSFKRRWRVLLTGVRLAERKAWSSTNESVRDLHRKHLKDVGSSQGGADLRTPIKRTTSADHVLQGGNPLLHPELGTASELATPGGFRRAHVLGSCTAGAALASSKPSSASRSGQSTPGVAASQPANQAYAGKPLSVYRQYSDTSQI